ncbi:hypothetical protein AB0G06_43345 [Nonomuraea dietziae]|uniref:hypothetical protein n=1 Tax=Nonomuraea dietziae TaxID=65515 RepID=UPI00340303A5
MSLPGPQDLLELDSPKLVWSAKGIEVWEAAHPNGGTYGEIVAKVGEMDSLDLAFAIEHYCAESRMRDAFRHEGDICMNFWKEAA